jgi:hypothetical protein
MAGYWRLIWWSKPIPKVKLFHQHDLIQSFDNGDDYEIETETGMRMLFSAALFAELKYEWDYNSAANSSNKEQAKWFLGLGYDW